MHALIENGNVVKYPYSINDIVRQNPGTSFPAVIPDSVLEEFNIFRIFFSNSPPFDSSQIAEESTPVFNAENNQWVQSWLIRNKTESEIQAEMLILKNSIVIKAQERLDTFAQSRNYDNILSACSYASSQVPKFQSEGQQCVNARDNTWAALSAILDEVQSGAREVPAGFAEIESELPVLQWSV